MSSWFRFSFWRVAALLFSFTIFFYWKILFTNRYMFPWDAADVFYPYLSFVHEQLRHLRFPLWDPYALSGFPIIGYIEAQIFYPINWLFVLVSPFAPLSYKLVEAQIILHFFLAGLFMFFLARDFTNNTFASLVAGVLFMSSGAMVAHTQHLAQISAMAWYPPIFLFARRGLLKKHFASFVLAGALFGIQVLAGHWQHSVYLGFFLFLYFAYEACFGAERSRLWPRWILGLAVIAGIGAALAMVQIVPTQELGSLSVRSQLTYGDVTDGNERQVLWTLFLPNFLGGLNGAPRWYPVDVSMTYLFLTVPGCLLALLGIAEMVRRRNYFWLGMFLLLTELSFGANGYLGSLIYHTPLLNMFRNPARYFDPVNFGLCLMAAIGTESLFSRNLWRPIQRALPTALLLLLVIASGVGLLSRLDAKIPGWYHLLAVLALLAVLVTGWLRGKLNRPAAEWAVFLLLVIQLCQYNMNQPFNLSAENPRIYMSYDYAVGRKESLQFLRSDESGDYRVAAIAEYPWSGNGSNIWRIPGVYGWNPLMLPGYGEYIRSFTQTSAYALPYGGPDHRLESPLLDLLGVKYLLVTESVEQEQRLAESAKFDEVFNDNGWWKIHRNPEFLSRAWFYTHAYVLPDRAQALALMNSRWFQARKALLFAIQDLPPDAPGLAMRLATVALLPEQITAASGGALRPDPACAEQRSFWGDWNGTGAWIRFPAPNLPQPGRYSLLIEYAAAYSAPATVITNVTQGNVQSTADPVVLPRTTQWACSESRIAELGEFELSAAETQITLILQQDPPLNVYRLWLIRLPEEAASASSEMELPLTPDFSFHDFRVTENRYAFRAELAQDGFVLVNEIFYPGWEATVNGQPAEILRADHIFRALALPAGSHRIGMRFRPRHFWLGAAVSLLTLAGLLRYFIRHQRKKRAA